MRFSSCEDLSRDRLQGMYWIVSYLNHAPHPSSGSMRRRDGAGRTRLATADLPQPPLASRALKPRPTSPTSPRLPGARRRRAPPRHHRQPQGRNGSAALSAERASLCRRLRLSVCRCASRANAHDPRRCVGRPARLCTVHHPSRCVKISI